jgi:hypothetical protein
MEKRQRWQNHILHWSHSQIIPEQRLQGYFGLTGDGVCVCTQLRRRSWRDLSWSFEDSPSMLYSACGPLRLSGLANALVGEGIAKMSSGCVDGPSARVPVLATVAMGLGAGFLGSATTSTSSTCIIHSLIGGIPPPGPPLNPPTSPLERGPKCALLR